MKIASKEFVVKKMTELMITPKKKFSQNFLIDYSTVKDSIDALNIEKDDVIIEIGPGLGALSQEILERGYALNAYEIDEDMVEHLKKYFSYYPSFHVEKVDFLKVDLSQYEGKKVKFISNIPYNVTTPILEKIVTSSLDTKCFEFMVQKEVYDRIRAKQNSKDYSPLNIFIEYVGKLEVVKKVPKQNFIPSPNVDSIILKIDFINERQKDIEKEFVNITKASFLMRRKTMLNNLSIFCSSKEKAKELLTKAGIEENARAESLSKEDYLRLARIYKELIGK
ncbi:MAG: 16S rRNA (adenine(1518)-N(6)/adenine(1519)-N(6))-dimethyltransferase RsmA [Bacilli bacterium]